ncbi:MAG TPA: CoA transferase [Candidatus Limnocylindria bacterium]|nr:CoA transferase [Candidatus Limnocylindria bacterium]
MTRQRLPHEGKGYALGDVRVLELTNFVAGPYCGMLLADMGADVIKVENPKGGDFTRGSAPFIEGESAGFLAMNRNKRSIALDLKQDRGREIFLDLVRASDVVVENLRPGTLEDLRIGYDALAQANPRIILSSATGFGLTGPYKHRAALDLIVQGMSGLMAITGEEGRPPVKIGVPISDLASALFSAYGILCALRVRDATGEGQHLDVSLLESAIALQTWETSGYFATGEVPERLGSAHRINAPYQAFRTKDGYVTIGATSPANWDAFVKATGLERLNADPRFANGPLRRKNYKELAAEIETATTTETSEHWYRLLEKVGVPCGVLKRLDEVVADEHVRARGVVRELTHPRVGRVRAIGNPVRPSKMPVRHDRAAPLLGEHTREILDELGVRDADALEASGVIATAGSAAPA